MSDTIASYGKGPDPIIDRLASEEGIAAIERTLRQGHAISENEAHALLNWIVVDAREGLQKNYAFDAWKNVVVASIGVLAKKDLTGFCGVGQSSTAYPLAAMALPVKLLQLGRLPHANNQHAVVVTKIPVKTQDGTVEKTYLLDTTWRQYFDGRLTRRLSSDAPENAGGVLVNKLAAADVNDELLSHGFLDVSEGIRGRLYFVANNSGRDLDVAAYLDQAVSEEADHDSIELALHLPSTTPAGTPYDRVLARSGRDWVQTAHVPFAPSGELSRIFDKPKSITGTVAALTDDLPKPSPI